MPAVLRTFPACILSEQKSIVVPLLPQGVDVLGRKTNPLPGREDKYEVLW